MGKTTKFDSTERWMITTAVEQFKNNWIKETQELEAEGKRALFTVPYIEYLIQELNNKIDAHTSAKVLKEELKKAEQ